MGGESPSKKITLFHSGGFYGFNQDKVNDNYYYPKSDDGGDLSYEHKLFLVPLRLRQNHLWMCNFWTFSSNKYINMSANVCDDDIEDEYLTPWVQFWDTGSN